MSLKINGPKPYFWQWDLDRQIIVNEDTCGEVHFCNGTTDCALVCVVYQQDDQRGVDVPNILLQTAKPLTAYLYRKGSDGSLTRHRQTFQVMARNKPDGYVYTETEAKSWDALEERIRVLEENGTGGGTVKSVNGVSPDEAGNVEIEIPAIDDMCIESTGELLLAYTATFATDAKAKIGVQVVGASVTALLDTVYWLEVNGEMLKCHWEQNFINVDLYDEEGTRWVAKTVNGDYVGAPKAGTYTYKLYAPSENLVLNPKHLPKAPTVADAAGETVTAAEFNALLTALRNAGYLES